MPLKEFVKQPASGMLYDLNRSEVVVLTFIKDPKWINDYAVAKVIQELKLQLDEKAQESETIWNEACNKILSDISETFFKNLHRADNGRDKDIFQGIAETIKNFPIPVFKSNDTKK